MYYHDFKILNICAQNFKFRIVYHVYVIELACHVPVPHVQLYNHFRKHSHSTIQLLNC